MTFEIPTIDIGSFIDDSRSSEQAAIAKKLDTACTEVGFVQIVGHAIPDEVIEDLAHGLDEFFALPLGIKKQYRRSPEQNRGYSPPKSESLSMSLGTPSKENMNDFYESIVVGTEASDYPEFDLPHSSYAPNAWPVESPRFTTAVQTYFRHAQSLSRVLLRAFTAALNLENGYFDDLVHHSIDAFKMNNYALPDGDTRFETGATGMGAHTDFGILTILWADRVPGLQILGPDGRWHDAQPADGALLLNLGDAMARWTNDRWMSTVHRVDPPIVDGLIIRRRSAAFFFDGNHDAVIETLPGCAREGVADYPPITVAENIAAKVAGLRTGVAPTGATREAARVLAAQ
ncbi:isopenicillin N synthase family dioxygenase [Rhodococcus sp. IEGM1428]|uniref:isopenicillin N synthase family dioxygenase n=1 Tax=Rhodococcus sp. IEGM1428 TaxID=3392191 RepID=UPI003D0A3CE8